MRIVETIFCEMTREWSEANGNGPDASGLESLVHEIAHLADAVGGIPDHGFSGPSVNQIIGAAIRTPTGGDRNEVRASSVTRHVLLGLGLLSDRVEQNILCNMRGNVFWMTDERVRTLWESMKDSPKTKRLAKMVTAYLYRRGVIEQ